MTDKEHFEAPIDNIENPYEHIKTCHADVPDDCEKGVDCSCDEECPDLACSKDCPACAFEAGKKANVPSVEEIASLLDYNCGDCQATLKECFNSSKRPCKQQLDTATAIHALITGKKEE